MLAVERDISMTESTDDQNPALLTIHRQRLKVLEQQSAQFGLFIPPHIQLELEATHQAIARLEADSASIVTPPDPSSLSDVVLLFTTSNGETVLTARGAHGQSCQVPFVVPWSEDRINYLLYVLRTAARSTATVRSVQLHHAGIDPREIGHQLYQAIFSPPVAQLYAAAQASAEGRVRLRIHTPTWELARLPWEVLHNGDDFLCLDRDTPTVRGVTVRPRANKPETPLRVLVIGGIVSTAAPLRLDQEQAIIERNLAMAIQRGDVVLQTLIGPMLEQELPSVLGGFCPHVLHVAGHGGLEGLVVTDRDGRPRQLSASTLGRLLRNVKSVKMVVLNGCELAATDIEQPGMAATLAQLGIPTVVGMQFEISDVAALAFAEGFYEALGWGWPAEEAISWARSRMTYYAPTPDVMEWVTPAVYVATDDVKVREVEAPPANVSNDAIYRGLLEITWDDDVVSDADQARLERKRVDLEISPERAEALEREVRLTLAASALAAAQTALKAGEFEPARSLYRRTLLLDPENLTALSAMRRWAAWPDDLLPISRANVDCIEELWRINLPGRIFATAWSPNGQSLALATEWGLMIYDIDTLQIQFKLSGADVLSYSVAWSPDGRFLAAGGDNGIVRLWDIANSMELRAIRGPQAHIHGLAWRPYLPHTLAVGDHEGNLQLWEVRRRSSTEPAAPSPLEGHGGAIYSLAWSPDGQTLASGSGDRTIHLTRPGDETQQFLQGHADWVRRLTWHPNGTLLASSSGDQSVCIWDCATTSLSTRLSGHSGWVRGLEWSADGSVLISGGGDGRVRIWDSLEHTQLRELGGSLGMINDLALRPDGRVLAVGSFEGMLTLWGVPPL
jgi:hypothetical protein